MSAVSADSPVFTLGHSPDPDDAFMFYAMAENKIDLRGYRFEHRLEDIQTLNERAMRGELHISAISIHAYAYARDKYALLPCGASMGDGYGPMVVAVEEKRPTSNVQRPTFNAEDERREWLRGKRIAVPGKMTSAFLALQLYMGEFDHVVIPFDKIFDALKAGEADAGLIIHEGQLTYAGQGLKLIVDLGKWWREETGLPLPLGANAIRRDLGQTVMEEVTALLRQSIEYGLDHRQEALEHALQYGRDLDRSKADTFVGMYVNDWTLDFGERGREAVATLLRRGHEAGIIPQPVELEFIG